MLFNLQLQKKYFFKFFFQEWDDYYAGLSVAIDNDAHFITLIKNQFKLE